MGILKRKKADHLEKKEKRRSRFVSVTPTDFIENDENENDGNGAAVCVRVVDDIESRTLLEEIRRNVRECDTRLYEGVECGLEQNELAEKLGITSHAAESQRRRLRKRLREKKF